MQEGDRYAVCVRGVGRARVGVRMGDRGTVNV